MIIIYGKKYKPQDMEIQGFSSDLTVYHLTSSNTACEHIVKANKNDYIFIHLCSFRCKGFTLGASTPASTAPTPALNFGIKASGM